VKINPRPIRSSRHRSHRHHQGPRNYSISRSIIYVNQQHQHHLQQQQQQQQQQAPNRPTSQEHIYTNATFQLDTNTNVHDRSFGAQSIGTQSVMTEYSKPWGTLGAKSFYLSEFAMASPRSDELTFGASNPASVEELDSESPRYETFLA